MIDQTESAFDDNSEQVPTCGPDWDAIEAGLAEIDFAAEIADMRAEDLEKAFKVIQGLMAWVNQNGSTNLNGVAIRALIVCWLCLPQMQKLSLTQLAKGYGMKKQSFGRWLEEKPLGFKTRFPLVKTEHLNFG